MRHVMMRSQGLIAIKDSTEDEDDKVTFDSLLKVFAKYIQEVKTLSTSNLGRWVSSVSQTRSCQSIASSVDQVALALNIWRGHVVRIPVDPLSLVQPWQHLLQESVSIALARVDTKLSDPDGLLEGVVELDEVVLEILCVGPGVVVGDNEVDLAVTAPSHELLKVVDALVGFGTVGYGRRANLEAGGGEGLYVFLVRGDGLVDGYVATSATVESLEM